MKLIIVKPLVYSSRLISEQYPEYIEDYDSIFEFMNDHDIKYTKEIVDGDHAEVKSKIITSKRDEYTIDYKLMKTESGGWMVYDVVIEGVSLVSNYRTQFNKIIMANGYPELVKKLQVKSKEIKM